MPRAAQLAITSLGHQPKGSGHPLSLITHRLGYDDRIVTTGHRGLEEISLVPDKDDQGATNCVIAQSCK